MDTRVKREGKTASKRPASVAKLKKRPYKHASIKQPTWQNPLLEYWSARRRPRLHRPLSRRTRLEYQIMAMLALFSLSIGLWENFRQLWLQGNGFSATDVSNITSFGMVLSVIGVLIVGKTIKMPNIKRFMTVTLLLRSINMLILYFLNQSGLTPLVVLSTALDVVTGSLIITSVYPLLTTVMKSNRAYSRRKLVEYLFRDLGVLVGGILIGQQIGDWFVNYNTCLMVAMFFSLAAAAVMWRMHLTLTETAPRDKFSAVKFVMRSRVHRIYMLYVFIAGAAYNTAIGLRMLMLTDYFDLSASMATNYLLIVGLASDVLGILALRYFTPKSDYASMTIKFGTRFGLFTLAFATGNFFLCFLSLTWTLLSSTAYENISDGYYINSVDNRHQLKYNTLKYVVNYAGDALGLFLCGQMFSLGPGYIFGMSAFLIVLQLIAAFRLIYVRQHYGFRRN